MPVSELEKKPDKKIRTTRMVERRPSGASFKSVVCSQNYFGRSSCKKKCWMATILGTFLSVQNNFQYQFAAKERQHEKHKPCQGESHRGVAAPTEYVTTP